MGTRKEHNIPADKLELYEKLVSTNLEVERKGAANPYTSMNGHMFTYLNPSGTLALRLPRDEREKFLKKYNTTLFEAYGAVMKEYVTVPDSLLKKTKELSYGYVRTLKPKPTRRRVDRRRRFAHWILCLERGGGGAPRGPGGPPYK